jgi:hypothetical protein
MEEVPGSAKFFPAQLVFLALGFLGPQVDIIKSLGLRQDARSNIQTPNKARFNGLLVHSYSLNESRNSLLILKVCLPLAIVVVDNL